MTLAGAGVPVGVTTPSWSQLCQRPHDLRGDGTRAHCAHLGALPEAVRESGTASPTSGLSLAPGHRLQQVPRAAILQVPGGNPCPSEETPRD